RHRRTKADGEGADVNIAPLRREEVAQFVNEDDEAQPEHDLERVEWVEPGANRRDCRDGKHQRHRVLPEPPFHGRSLGSVVGLLASAGCRWWRVGGWFAWRYVCVVGT